MRTTDLVQRLQVAGQELGLEAAITKLDKYQPYGPEIEPRRRKRRSDTVAVCGMNMGGQVFKTNEITDRDTPEAIAAFVHRQLVGINVP